jgi:hypothetical protein
VAHRRLGRSAGGDIAQVDGERRRPGQIDLRDRQLHRELAPVAAPRDRLGGQAQQPRQLPGQQRVDVGAVRLVQPVDHQQIGDREAHRLLARTRKRQLRRRVELADASVLVDDDDRIECRLDNRPISGFAHRMSYFDPGNYFPHGAIQKLAQVNRQITPVYAPEYD